LDKEINYKGYQIKEFFDIFSRTVKEKQYKPVDYKVWRQMKGSTELYNFDNFTHKISFGNKYIELFITAGYSNSPYTFYFTKDDNSFGTFLYDYCYNEKEEDDVMMPVKALNGECYIDTGKIVCNESYYGTVNKIDARIAALEEKIDTKVNKYDNDKKENEKMKFNFDFGPVDDNKVRMSMYGFAIKNPCGTYIAYDTKTNSIIDVDAFNFGNASKMVYKVPVALKDVAVGDVVVHNGKPMFVCMINGSELTVIDIYNGEKKGIIPTKSMFGFNFITKIVSLFSVNGFNASEDNPFGNVWPLLMMGDNKDMKDILPLMLMANGGFDTSNPMMLYALMGDNRCGDMLPLMLMMNQSAVSAKPAPAHECKCGGNCEK
jgi:hypothetical protein